jgi:hypothetical protein
MHHVLLSPYAPRSWALAFFMVVLSAGLLRFLGPKRRDAKQGERPAKDEAA